MESESTGSSQGGRVRVKKLYFGASAGLRPSAVVVVDLSVVILLIDSRHHNATTRQTEGD
jgi:hypothetical protein